MKQVDKAEALFNQGYNCAQAVYCAFAEELGIDEKTALRAASSLGGGLAHTGEVCGALLGMEMAVGNAKGYDTPEPEAKQAHSATVKRLAEWFKDRFGATGCEALRNPGDRAVCTAYVREAAAEVAREIGVEG